MGDLNMTAKPLRLKIDLTRDSDFLRAMEPVDDTTFPEGSAITLEFGNLESGEVKWAADVTPTLASWHVDKAQVNALIAQAPRSCKLRYTSDDGDIIWATTTRVEING